MAVYFFGESMETKQVIELSQKYLMQNYGRFDLQFVRGQGSYLYDENGKAYLDLLAGIAVNSLGHCHPQLVQALKKQSETLWHTTNLFYIEVQSQLAALLCQEMGYDKAFFCNSGAEANEAAIKIARRWGVIEKGPHCFHIVSTTNSFHGRTLATMAATGQEKIQKDFGELPKGFRNIPFNDIDAARAAITEETCAFILEPIQGEYGVVQASNEYLQALRKLCDEKNILLIADEIQTGLGRCGALLAHQKAGIQADIVSLAKGLGGGFPIGAVLCHDKEAKHMGPGSHGTTFGGNFLASTVALEVLKIVKEESFLKEINDKGQYFREALRELNLSCIQSVEGQGLMIAMVFKEDCPALVQKFLNEGLIINWTPRKAIRLLPALTISKEEIDQSIPIFKKVLGDL